MIPMNTKLYISKAELHDKQILTSSAKAVVIYGDMNSTLEVSFRRWEYLGNWRIWVTTSQGDSITRTRDFTPNTFHGTFSFSHQHQEISSFKNFIQTSNSSKCPEYVSLVRLVGDVFQLFTIRI